MHCKNVAKIHKSIVGILHECVSFMIRVHFVRVTYLTMKSTPIRLQSLESSHWFDNAMKIN